MRYLLLSLILMGCSVPSHIRVTQHRKAASMCANHLGVQAMSVKYGIGNYTQVVCHDGKQFSWTF